jgi:DNA-binding transcriptional ArsR family regulator
MGAGQARWLITYKAEGRGMRVVLQDEVHVPGVSTLPASAQTPWPRVPMPGLRVPLPPGSRRRDQHPAQVSGLGPSSWGDGVHHGRSVASPAATRRGTAVLLTIHYLEEADRLADRIGILHRGRLVTEGTPQELKAALTRRRITVYPDPRALETTLRRTVAAALAACDEAVGGALALRWPTVPGPGPSAALLESWTGRPLPPNLREDLTAVTRLTLLPTHGLGATLTAYRAASHWIVWAEPAAPPESTELVAGGALQRVLQALADPVSYAVVEHLAAGHAHTGAGLAAVLGVHPSTVSRHLRALQEVGLIAATGTGGRVRYHVRVAALQSLAGGLGALADRATGIPESDP